MFNKSKYVNLYEPADTSTAITGIMHSCTTLNSTKPLFEHKVDMLTSSTKVVKAKLVHDESKDRGQVVATTSRSIHNKALVPHERKSWYVKIGFE